MTRLIVVAVVVGLVELVVLVGGFAAFEANRSYLWEAVINLAPEDPAWRVTVTYPPNQPRVRLTVRMYGLSRFQTVEYRVVSSEQWLQLWEGRLSGRLAEAFVLEGDEQGSPWPMTASRAGQIAQSIRVRLVADGVSKVIDFTGRNFATPVPWFDELFLVPRSTRLVQP